MNSAEFVGTKARLYQPSSTPYGVSLGEWCKLWWRWLLSIPKSVNPVSYKTVNLTNQYQNDHNVWFLAGTFGGSAIRKCNVPNGKAILFPVINYEASFADEPELEDPQQLENKCKVEMDNIGRLYCRVNGQLIDIKQFRIQSNAFKIDIPPNNCLSVKSGTTTMASDGYWLFLQPLPSGKHVIESFGSCLAGKVKIGCTYQLIVH